MYFETDAITVSLDDLYRVSFYLATQKEELKHNENDLKDGEVPEKGEKDNDIMMEIDEPKVETRQRRPLLEGMARYVSLIVLSCDSECFNSCSPTQILLDSMRFVCLFVCFLYSFRIFHKSITRLRLIIRMVGTPFFASIHDIQKFEFLKKGKNTFCSILF